jgi:hypothetical protein
MGNDAIVKDDVPGTPGSVTQANTETSNVWQTPLTFCFGWWSASMAAFWLPTVVQSAVPHHEPHEQLILPEAIAAESVPSLFA